MEINNRIANELSALELSEDITILYACESGSRAWGFSSLDSDYDVRFIYARKLEWYLSIDDKKDTIELPINDTLDLAGWDLRKALKLFRNSNAVIYEWIQSPIVYKTSPEFITYIRSLQNNYSLPRAAMHHYLSMAKSCYEQELSGEEVKLKKYFYALRPVLAALWIGIHHSVPPMEFGLLRPFIENKTINEIIDNLLAQKKMASESFCIKAIPELNDFIWATYERCIDYSKKLDQKEKGDMATLNRLFRKSLQS